MLHRLEELPLEINFFSIGWRSFGPLYRTGVVPELVQVSPRLKVTTQANQGGRWSTVWLDILAFAAWLSLAWQLQWRTTDLVWSLWLSSLLVGYAMIFWGIFGPILGTWIAGRSGESPVVEGWAGFVAALTAGMFMLMFFTIHFGGFHFVHSMFLNTLFPVSPGVKFPSPGAYWTIVRRYWLFVLCAAISERQAFRSPTSDYRDGQNKSGQNVQGMRIFAPYINVLRMHLLIFFFVFARGVHLDNAWVYIVVFAVYYFPWRFLKSAIPAGLHLNR
jgi:Family of unknown function (DUF6498)